MFTKSKTFFSRLWEKLTAKGGENNVSWSLLFLIGATIWVLIRTTLALISLLS